MLLREAKLRFTLYSLGFEYLIYILLGKFEVTGLNRTNMLLVPVFQKHLIKQGSHALRLVQLKKVFWFATLLILILLNPANL